MPSYTLTDPEGQSVTVTGDSPPTEQEAEEIFATVGTQQRVQSTPDTSERSGYGKDTFDQWKAKAIANSQKSMGEQALELGQGVGRGILHMARTGVSAVGETFNALKEGELSKVAKSLPEGVAKSVFDMYDMGEAISGRIGDQFVSDEEAYRRGFARYQQDNLDQEKRQKGLMYSSQETLPALTETMSILGDPTNLMGFGVAGKLGKASKLGKMAEKTGAVLDLPSRAVRASMKGSAKLGAKGAQLGLRGARMPLKILSGAGKATEAVAGIPRRTMSALIGKSLGVGGDSRALSGFTKLGGVATGPTGASLVALETAGNLASKSSKLGLQAEKVLGILSDSKRQARFIDEVLLDPTISPKVKKGVKLAGLGGGRALDLAFNSIANGVTTATLQGILTKMATDDPGAIGEAMGAGALFGGLVPVGPVKGRLTPEQMNTVARKRIDNWAEKQQVENLGNMSAQDKTMITSLASGVNDMDIRLMDADSFNMFFESEKGSANKEGTGVIIDDDGVLWIDSSHKDVTPDVVTEMTNRVGQDYFKHNPDALDSVVNSFADDAGIELTHANGETVKVGGDFADVIVDYNKNQVDGAKITTTEQAVQKYLGNQVEVLFLKNNPNFIKTLTPEMQQVLRDVSHSALGRIGLVDQSGNGYVGKKLPRGLGRMASNKAITKGINNLENLNKSLQGEQVRSAKQQASDAHREQRANETREKLNKREADKADREAKAEAKREKAHQDRKDKIDEIFNKRESNKDKTSLNKKERLDRETQEKLERKRLIEEDTSARKQRQEAEREDIAERRRVNKEALAEGKKSKKEAEKVEKDLLQKQKEADELNQALDDLEEQARIQRHQDEADAINEENRIAEQHRLEDENDRLRAEADLDELSGERSKVVERVTNEKQDGTKESNTLRRDRTRFTHQATTNKGVNEAKIINWKISKKGKNKGKRRGGQSLKGRLLGNIMKAFRDTHAIKMADRLQRAMNRAEPLKIDVVYKGTEGDMGVSSKKGDFHLIDFGVSVKDGATTRVLTRAIDLDVMRQQYPDAQVHQDMLQIKEAMDRGKQFKEGERGQILSDPAFENNSIVIKIKADAELRDKVNAENKKLKSEGRDSEMETESQRQLRSANEALKSFDIHNVLSIDSAGAPIAPTPKIPKTVAPEGVPSPIRSSVNMPDAPAGLRGKKRATSAFSEDIPSEQWLSNKIEDVKDRGTNKYGTPFIGSITGNFKGNLLLPLSKTKNLKGAMGEHTRPLRKEDVDSLTKELERDGSFEHAPLVIIHHNGTPYVMEGNHRIEASHKAGIPIEIEVKYADGGQRVAKSGWDVDSLSKLNP